MPPLVSPTEPRVLTRAGRVAYGIGGFLDQWGLQGIKGVAHQILNVTQNFGRANRSIRRIAFG